MSDMKCAVCGIQADEDRFEWNLHDEPLCNKCDDWWIATRYLRPLKMEMAPSPLLRLI